MMLLLIMILLIVVVPKGPVGSSCPLCVAQATRKHDYIQTVLRILYRVLFGIAGALLPYTFLAHGIFNPHNGRGTSLIGLAGAALARPYHFSRGRRNAFRMTY